MSAECIFHVGPKRPLDMAHFPDTAPGNLHRKPVYHVTKAPRPETSHPRRRYFKKMLPSRIYIWKLYTKWQNAPLELAKCPLELLSEGQFVEMSPPPRNWQDAA